PNREVKPYSADGTAPSGWESRTLPDQYTSLECITQGFFYWQSLIFAIDDILIFPTVEKFIVKSKKH
ncbi:MAG: hypothetical protein J5I59_11740, partial [Saprospiraceae bacterium]|nr:hypothetical protein [Saprospiraceae bacterium]